MPFQSIFFNAFQNDIENSQLWQQTAAALQSNKFVQVCLKKKTRVYIILQNIQKKQTSSLYAFNVLH